MYIGSVSHDHFLTGRVLPAAVISTADSYRKMRPRGNRRTCPHPLTVQPGAEEGVAHRDHEEDCVVQQSKRLGHEGIHTIHEGVQADGAMAKPENEGRWHSKIDWPPR